MRPWYLPKGIGVRAIFSNCSLSSIGAAYFFSLILQLPASKRSVATGALVLYSVKL
jgi:hypothetical protein